MIYVFQKQNVKIQKIKGIEKNEIELVYLFYKILKITYFFYKFLNKKVIL